MAVKQNFMFLFGRLNLIQPVFDLRDDFELLVFIESSGNRLRRGSSSRFFFDLFDGSGGAALTILCERFAGEDEQIAGRPHCRRLFLASGRFEGARSTAALRFRLAPPGAAYLLSGNPRPRVRRRRERRRRSSLFRSRS